MIHQAYLGVSRITASLSPSAQEPRENHTALYCPQPLVTQQNWLCSRQADNTLVLCQRLDTKICHGQWCTTIDSTDWSGEHSWLWHWPPAHYWIAAPHPIYPPSHMALNSAINATHFNRTSTLAPRTEEEKSGWGGVKSFFGGQDCNHGFDGSLKMTKYATGCWSREPVAQSKSVLGHKQPQISTQWDKDNIKDIERQSCVWPSVTNMRPSCPSQKKSTPSIFCSVFSQPK